MQKLEKVFWIENLKAICIIGVVFGHTTIQLTYSFGKIPSIDWWVANIYIALCRFCVPVFVMVTGALLLGRPYELSSFFKRRFSRVLLPFLFWSLVYIFSDIIFYKVTSIKDILEYIHQKLFFGAAYHLWYVYMLLGLLLIHPIINKWLINSSNKEIIYFMLVCVFTALINYYPFNFFATQVDLSYFTRYVFLFVAGYYFFHRQKYFINRVRIHQCNRILSIISITMVIAIFMNTYWDSVQNNSNTERYKPWDLFFAISIFMIFRINRFFNKKSKFLALVSKYSYGIYLIHVLFIIVMNTAVPYLYYPLFSIPLFSFIILMVSIAVLFAIEKLPFGKYITQ